MTETAKPAYRSWSLQSESETTTLQCDGPTSFTSDVVISVFIVILLIVGVVGNVVTLCVIVKNKHLRTNFNRFLMSLCASDLVSAVICSPLWLYRRTWGFSEWNLSPVLCKFYWVSDFATDYATSLHILSFCILRFLAINYPLTAPTKRFSIVHFRIYIASLWAVSCLVAAPHAYFMDVWQTEGQIDQWPSCSIDRDLKNEYHIYSVVIYSLFFYVPALLIIVLSFLTSRSLSRMTDNSPVAHIHDTNREARLRQRTNNKSACIQLRLICACFTFGYVSIAAYLIWTSASDHDPTDCSLLRLDYWFGVSSYLILRVSECLNPVMYNLGCKEMRTATFAFIKNSVFRRASNVARVQAQQRDVILTSIFSQRRATLPGEENVTP